jgi:hypothetical protein
MKSYDVNLQNIAFLSQTYEILRRKFTKYYKYYAKIFKILHRKPTKYYA